MARMNPELSKGDREALQKNFGYNDAKDILLAMGFKNDRIPGILERGIRKIRSGEPWVSNNLPISGYKMREKLRTWQEGEKHQLYINQKKKDGENLP